mmetsp:Transcript_29801/g.68640  ORF Transcript_29801/g.68640 Transcript_29801/m.68640 type:complete len:843 (+) Transcript_29801:36-2564(+)
MAAAEAHGWRARLRILCLHGHTQTASVFEQKVSRLVTKASSFAEFVFVDGPVELPLRFGERINTCGWWPDNATAGDCDDELVEKSLATAWSEQGPFDGVLGFSEGATAAHLFCRMAETVASSDVLSPGEGLRFAIFAGAPAPRAAWASRQLELSTLHLASAADAIVPLKASQLLTKCFSQAKLIEHEGGHGVPQRVEEVRQIVDWLHIQMKEIRGAVPIETLTNRIDEQQLDELETLDACFPDGEITRVSPAWPVRVLYKIRRNLVSEVRDGGILCFTMPPGYPQDATCRCQLETDSVSLREHAEELLAAVDAEQASLGNPSIMQQIAAGQKWVDEYDERAASLSASGDRDANAELDQWWLREELDVKEDLLGKAEKRATDLLREREDAGQTWASREAGAVGYSKPWNFVVGLVGKPSVGKSTFFNAATRPEQEGQEAPMAPHPFTTIDPNVSGGWFAAPNPVCSVIPEPSHGKVSDGRRRHPLVVKDVAGLVPGAYLGKGRGNAFLNDLCDADSLIHIVDASGRSDKEGVDMGGGTTGSDPLDEVGWVRREIHLWIFSNIRSKWDTVRRKARLPSATLAKEAVIERLFNLFTGYRATHQMAIAVYEAAGFSLQNIAETILSWSEYELHLLVACFLRMRFPILIAMNKVDMPGAAENVQRVKAALGDKCVPVCAASEWWLWEQKRKGFVEYLEGGGAEGVRISDSAPAAVLDRWRRIRSEVLDKWGATGVMQALSAAVSMRRPVLVCPVIDFLSFQGLRTSCTETGADAKGTLSVMVMLRPQSTVDEAFSALKHEDLLRGDFVRAELLGDGGNVQVLRRSDVLKSTPGTALALRVLTNKAQK